MKIAAIIAEYNPFHSGHQYHISRTRFCTHATHTVAIMSGSFVQRGDVACLDKFTRARMALRNGVDLVIELPLPWAMSGAETFARGGVGIAAGLGCVDLLSFGSESGDAASIQRAASISESDDFKSVFQRSLATGSSFASAWAAAAHSVMPECAHLFDNPNDTLAIEYCRAIERLKCSIKPFSVKRIGANHDDMQSPAEYAATASASYLRRLIPEVLSGESDFIELKRYMPQTAYDLLHSAVTTQRISRGITLLDRSILLRLRDMSEDELLRLPDVGEGLEHRISKCAMALHGTEFGFSSLCDAIKCKRYTHARIRRILLSALLGLRADDSAGVPPYIRVLAMNARGKEILARATSSHSNHSLPIITRVSQISTLSERAQRIFRLETRATDLAGLTCFDVPPAGRDYTEKLIVE